MKTQNKMANHAFELEIYFKQLQRIEVRIKLMEQLKKAPFIYIYSMKETIRRQKFSQVYKTVMKELGRIDLKRNIFIYIFFFLKSSLPKLFII